MYANKLTKIAITPCMLLSIQTVPLCIRWRCWGRCSGAVYRRGSWCSNGGESPQQGPEGKGNATAGKSHWEITHFGWELFTVFFFYRTRILKEGLFAVEIVPSGHFEVLGINEKSILQ